MNIVNNVAINGVTQTGTVVSSAILSQFFTSMTVQAKFSDAAAAGSLKIQASNDASSPTNWNDITSSITAVASGALTMIPPVAMCYQYVRIAFVSSGGAGTITARFKALEAS